MKDEIKEINIPENVLVALGDLTNGALNYYKATETVKVRHNTILDYITNLQEKVNQYENPDDMTLFYMWLDEKAKDKMKQLQKENERLKENVIHNDKVVDEAKWNEMLYKSRNEKAIEKIKKIQKNAIKYGADHDAIMCQDLLNILQGDDKDE